MTTYRRQDVLRIFEMSSRQLQAWERAGLIPQQEIYSFQDLGQLRILCALRAEDVSAASIRDSVLAMKAVSGMANPLLETRVVRTGTRLAFRHHGAMVNPIRGQFLFDFERGRPASDRRGCRGAVAAAPPRARQVPRAPSGSFLAAVHAEEAAEKQRAISLYEEILTLDPDYAAACINLGTIYFHLRQHGRAEDLYRRATVADPDYVLAYFDLGNVLDDLRTSQRIHRGLFDRPSPSRRPSPTPTTTWRSPMSASAQQRPALRHWRAYVKLDNRGPWADHARGQIGKLLSREKLAIVSRASRFIAPRKGMAALKLA